MNKKEVEEKIKNFFEGKHDKEKVRKIKKLAMSYQIKLGDKRKLFCNQCCSMNLRVLGIKKGVKRVECEECKNISRYKLNN